MRDLFLVEETTQVCSHHSAAPAWALLKTSVLCVRVKTGLAAKSHFLSAIRCQVHPHHL